MKRIIQFLKDEDGISAVEYGLLAALIAIAIVGVLGDIGGALNSKFGEVLTELTKSNN